MQYPLRYPPPYPALYPLSLSGADTEKARVGPRAFASPKGDILRVHAVSGCEALVNPCFDLR